MFQICYNSVFQSELPQQPRQFLFIHLPNYRAELLIILNGEHASMKRVCHYINSIPKPA